MHSKFIIVSRPDSPLIGTFVYGKVGSHRKLVDGYVKVHGGGWYNKDDEKKTMLLYVAPVITVSHDWTSLTIYQASSKAIHSCTLLTGEKHLLSWILRRWNG